jgi:CBS domain-containing protein
MNLTVADLLTPAPLVVVGETPLRQCAAAMRKHGFRHLPVVSPFGRLVGIVSDLDVLAHGALLADDEWLGFLSAPATATAMSVAQPVPLTATMDEPLVLFLPRWNDSGAEVVVVVDADQVPVGIITEHDVLQLVDLLPDVECPMSSPVTIAAGGLATIADRTMRELRTRHLVVEKGDKPIGVVTQSEAMARLGKGPTVPIARPARRLVTGTFGMSVKDVATMLLDERIGCLPIVADGTLQGVATRRHVLEALATELVMMPMDRARPALHQMSA